MESAKAINPKPVKLNRKCENTGKNKLPVLILIIANAAPNKVVVTTENKPLKSKDERCINPNKIEVKATVKYTLMESLTGMNFLKVFKNPSNNNPLKNTSSNNGAIRIMANTLTKLKLPCVISPLLP